MSWDETDLINKADINIYKELITIDEKLGTKMTEQLLRCVQFSFREDLFEMNIEHIRTAVLSSLFPTSHQL